MFALKVLLEASLSEGEVLHMYEKQKQGIKMIWKR